MLNTVNHPETPYLVTGLTATGSTQSTAFNLVNNALHEFTTVAASTGAILPVPEIPSVISIFNGGANALAIYPPSGGSINGGTMNSPTALPAGAGVTLWASSLSNWYQTQVSAEWVLSTPADASTVNFDLSTASLFIPAAMTGNRALTLSNLPAAQPFARPFTVVLTQDGTGSRSITSWFAGFTVRWAGGAPPTLTTTPNKSDAFVFVQIAATTLLGSVAGQGY